jgi:hypothetical protein
MRREITRLSYVDGYLRIRRTTPMILRAIERLDALKRRQEAAFWIEHLGEEAFHDRVMRADLSRLFGGSRAASAQLRKHGITPPSAALLGYFEWQVSLGNPSLLIAIRLFLEWYISELESWRVSRVDKLVDGGSAIMRTHRELDADHMTPCLAYVSRHCRNCETEVRWSVEFVGRCLRDAHLYIAEGLIREELRPQKPVERLA